jgi:hypothetical protein
MPYAANLGWHVKDKDNSTLIFLLLIPLLVGMFLSWHHLWFIAYLFIYDLVFAPLFVWMMASGRVQWAVGWLSRGKYVFLLAVPSIVWFTPGCDPFDEMPDLMVYYFVLNADARKGPPRLLNVVLRPVTAWAWVFEPGGVSFLHNTPDGDRNFSLLHHAVSP